MAAVVEGCGDLGAGNATQYVARWTEVAVVARERGYLPSDSVVSFDDAVACPAPLREVLDGAIEHEERWNRCAELVAERGLSMKAAVLLFATTMFCFTKDLVCTMTRAPLMAMTGIRTPASFAGAVRELMEQSLLSPKDGAPRTAWYLGEGFWGGMLVGEDLDTPVATLARRRRAAAANRGNAADARGDRRPAGAGWKRTGGASADTGTENRTSAVASTGRQKHPCTGIENRTSEPAPEDRRPRRAGSGTPAGADADTRASADDPGRQGVAGIENRTSGPRSGKAKVTVAAFAAEELPRTPVGTMIADRMEDYYGKRGEYGIARARLRGLAARVWQDIEGVGGAAAVERAPESRDRAAVARAGSRPRCRWCSSAFDHPAARGDRGDGVCRGCDARRSRDGPVQVGAIADEVGRRLGRG